MASAERETVRVQGGTLHRDRAKVWVIWDEHGRETWTLPDSAWGRQQARENFAAMKERWQ